MSNSSSSPVALLEREEESARIADRIARLGGGEGGLLLIEGDAGIGKTRLLGSAVEAAGAADLALLEARGRELESGFSFGLARQLLERPLREADEGRRAEILSGAAGLAAPLVLGDGAPLAADGDQFPLLHGLYWTVANLAEERPLLLAVDDAHWADAASLRFLAFLAPRLAELSVLLAMTTRPRTAEPLFAMLAREPDAELLRLGPLSPGAVGDLVSREFDAEADAAFVGACREVTGGNPFLLGELLTELGADGIAPASTTAARVRAIGPEGVRRVVLAEVAALAEAATPLARATAILEEARIEDAAALAEIGLAEARRAADELAAAGILADDVQLRFRHALVRNALYVDIPAQARSALHRRAASLLGESRGGGEAAATHLLRSAPAGEVEAFEMLIGAGRTSLARGGAEAAVDYLRRAVAEPPPEEAVGETLWLLARAESLAGNAAAATVRYEEALALLNDPDEWAEAVRQLATVYAMQEGSGQIARAITALEASLGGLEGGDPRTRVAVECDLICFARVGTGVDPATGEHIARMRALAEAGWEAEAPIGRRVRVRAAYDAMVVGEPVDLVRSLLDPALASAGFVDDEPVESAHFPVAALTLIALDDFAVAEELTEAGVASAQRRGSVVGFAQGSGYLALARLRRGAPVEAEADARAGLAVTPVPRSTPFLVACLVDALADQGRLAEAEAALAEHGMAELRSDDHFALHLLEARGRLRLAAGEVDRGLVDLLDAVHLQRFLGLENPATISSSSSAARALLAAGRREEASALATEELERARRFGAPRALGVALAVSGLTIGGEEGVGRLREAVTTLAGSGAELQLARARIDLGAALRRAGSRAEAAEHMGDGLRGAEALAAAGLAERAREELVAAGARPRPAAGGGAEALTASELRVARMATEGLSNPEIAQRLFVTRKTIEVHLSHAYRKLGISSRGELGEALAKD